MLLITACKEPNTVEGVWMYPNQDGKTVSFKNGVFTGIDSSIIYYEHILVDSAIKFTFPSSNEYVQDIKFLHQDTLVFFDWITGNDTCYRVKE